MRISDWSSDVFSSDLRAFLVDRDLGPIAGIDALDVDDLRRSDHAAIAVQLDVQKRHQQFHVRARWKVQISIYLIADQPTQRGLLRRSHGRRGPRPGLPRPSAPGTPPFPYTLPPPQPPPL